MEEDLGVVILPIFVGDVEVRNIHIDLDACVNLTIVIVVQRIGDLKKKTTMKILQMIDKTSRKLVGIIKDVMVNHKKISISYGIHGSAYRGRSENTSHCAFNFKPPLAFSGLGLIIVIC